jgi:hypothetical protein
VAIKSFDTAIYELFNGMSDAYIFKSLPGTGPCLAPRLLVAMGKIETDLKVRLKYKSIQVLRRSLSAVAKSHG